MKTHMRCFNLHYLLYMTHTDTYWKVKGERTTLEKECADALRQMEESQYVKNLQLEGYTNVICYGAAFLERHA